MNQPWVIKGTEHAWGELLRTQPQNPAGVREKHRYNRLFLYVCCPQFVPLMANPLPRLLLCSKLSGDMIFSGHTTCLLMSALIFRKYCRAKHLQTKVILRSFHLKEAELSAIRHAVFAYVALGCLVIIGSKLHYTLDVLLAILLTYW